MTTNKNPDLSNKEQRQKIYYAYLRRAKPFWYWSNKFSCLIGAMGGGLIGIILLEKVYSNLIGIAFLFLVIGLIGITITRYKLDGCLLKHWWEIY